MSIDKGKTTCPQCRGRMSPRKHERHVCRKCRYGICSYEEPPTILFRQWLNEFVARCAGTVK
jgi:hypothetical protein